MEELGALQELCQKQVTEVRTFVRNMRSLEVAGGAGLATALRYVTGAFQKDSGIHAIFQANFDATHDDLEPSMDMINIVREALHNAQKHSNASRVAVRLMREKGELRLEIEDDGRGFPFAGTFSLPELEALRLGPASIERRVRGLNGELTLESRPGRGASICVRVPL
jgi:signal transduction histidine kinase